MPSGVNPITRGASSARASENQTGAVLDYPVIRLVAVAQKKRRNQTRLPASGVRANYALRAQMGLHPIGVARYNSS